MTAVSFIAPELRRIDSAPVNAVAVFRFTEKEPFKGIGGLIDWRLYGHLSRMAIEGFFEGALNESMLVPLGRQIRPEALLLLGLGPKSQFDKQVFTDGMANCFKNLAAIEQTSLAISLPGRADDLATPTDAMNWFLECFDDLGDGKTVRIIEPQSAQEEMSPILERWRLKQLVPE